MTDSDSRIGWAWDPKVEEPYPALLRDREGQIELVIPFDPSDEVLERRFVGSMVDWGDDPEMSLHDYSLPDQFWFTDARGFVSLNGVRARTVEHIAGGPSIFNQSKLTFDYAVFGDEPGVDHSAVNGLTTRVEGLGQWFGHRSVQSNFDDPNRAGGEITLTINSTRTERIDAGMNLSILAGADWRLPGEAGRVHLEEVGMIRTTMKRPRPWLDHLQRHRSIHKLLELSAWSPLGFERVEAMHKNDPQRVLSGQVIGDRWSPVKTYSLPGKVPASRPDFLFRFDDIGAKGLRRWLRLEDRFQKGIHAMTFSIRHRGTSLDGLISDAGIGLEEIGHAIDLQRGGGRRRGHHDHLLDIALPIQDLLPFDAVEWATASTEIYNCVKHADRRDPTADELRTMLIKNRLVFRVWVARQIGVRASVIEGGMWRLKRGLSTS